MTKYEFLGDLSRLLSDLSEEERNEALQYYEDYFADAGREQEQAIIQELESPEKVAAKIRQTEAENLQYGEPGQMKDAAYPEVVDGSYRNADSDTGEWGSGEGNGQTEGFQKNGNSDQSASKESNSTTSVDRSNLILKWILVAILAIIIIPVVVPVIAGCAITILVLILTLFLTLFGTGIGLGVGGVVSMLIGLYHAITANVADAVVDIGAGFVMLPIGIILCYLGGLLLIKLTPGVWKLCEKLWDGICGIAQKIFH